MFSSKLESVTLQAGITYFVIIDGYGSAAGEYQLDITIDEPCQLTCPPLAQHENEPPLVPGYIDAHNGGCNSPESGYPFQEITNHSFCGVSGWYTDLDGQAVRDTDWFHITMPYSGVLEIIGDAEYPTYMFELAPQDCGSVQVVQNVIIGPCSEGTLTITGAPGSLVWLWVGPTTFSGPVPMYSYKLSLDLGTIDWPLSQVVIDPQPAITNASWELERPSGEVVFGQGYAALSAAPGTYNLTWLDTPGYITPEPASVSGQIWNMHYDLLYLTANYGVDLPYGTDFPAWPPPFFEIVSGLWTVTEGWYRCYNTAMPGLRHLSTIGSHHWTDYRVDIDIQCDGTPDREIVFRYQSPDDHYRFVVLPQPTNVAQVWKTLAGQSTLLHAQEIGTVDGSGTLRLGIAATGGTFRAYLDGVFLCEVDDPAEPWLAGGIALSSYADPAIGSQIASFANLWIEPLDAVAVAPLPAVAARSLAAVPNPFNPATVVRFELPQTSDVTLAVHDLRGRLVRTLRQGKVAAGRHEVMWDGRDGSGGAAASGVYLVRLVMADGEAQAVKVTLAK